MDDAYVSRSGDYWANLPLRPCAWAGAKMMATPRMREAMGLSTAVQLREAQWEALGLLLTQPGVICLHRCAQGSEALDAAGLDLLALVVGVAVLEGLVRSFMLRLPYDWRAFVASLADVVGRRAIDALGFSLTVPVPGHHGMPTAAQRRPTSSSRLGATMNAAPAAPNASTDDGSTIVPARRRCA